MRQIPILVAMIVACIASAGCGGKPVATKPVWRSDVAPLQQMLPFLGSITTCSWSSGIAHDRSDGFVPGPSAVFLKGYAVLTPDDERQLQSAYPWREEPGITIANLDLPPDSVPMTGPVLVSTELCQSLPSKCTYHQGKIYFLPQSHVIYFDLIKD